MTYEDNMSKNHEILAMMVASQAIYRMQQLGRPTPSQQLMGAIEEAIVDARDRCAAIESTGNAGSLEHMRLCAKLARWNEARRINR